MDAKDILRIALILLVAIFALRSGSFIKARNSARVNNDEETEDKASQHLLQQPQDTRSMKRINQEPIVYENKNVENEISI